MNQSQDVNELFSALSKAQATIKGALKDSTNPFFKSKYADLESVWEACREPLTVHGLSVVQTTEFSADAGIYVVTTLGHASGQWIKGTLPIMAIKQDPQGIGSAITYARRYALAAIVGIVQVDDDGESAMGTVSSAPERSTAEVGVLSSVSYRIPFGKWAQRSLEEVNRNHGEKAISDYIEYIESQALKKRQPVAGQAKEFVERAAAFLTAAGHARS